MQHLSRSLACLLLSSTCFAQSTNWVQVTTTNNPGPRWAHGNAFDSVRGRTICFGGGSGTLKGDDTWQYDGNNACDAAGAATKPPAGASRDGFHFHKLHTVMFGGSGLTADLNDPGRGTAELDQLSSDERAFPPAGSGMASDDSPRRAPS